MGGGDVQVGSTSSVCNLSHRSLERLPTCECAAGLGPGTDTLSGRYGCVSLPVAGPAPTDVAITYLSSTRARVTVSLLSNEQADIINVQLLALPRPTNDTNDVEVGTNGCPVDSDFQEALLRSEPACCLKEHGDACTAIQSSCSDAGAWSAQLDLDRNMSYALFSAYETAAGVVCTSHDAMVGVSSSSMEISNDEDNGSQPMNSTTLITLLTSLVSVFVISAILAFIVFRRLKKRNRAQAMEISQLHDSVSRRFAKEVLKDQAKAAQSRYNSIQCDRANVTTSKLLGEGYFGLVHYGMLNLKGVKVSLFYRSTTFTCQSRRQKFPLRIGSSSFACVFLVGLVPFTRSTQDFSALCVVLLDWELPVCFRCRWP